MMRSLAGMFVLTQREQRLIVFIVLALALGLLTKHYRQQHPGIKPAAAVDSGARNAASPGPDQLAKPSPKPASDSPPAEEE